MFVLEKIFDGISNSKESQITKMKNKSYNYYQIIVLINVFNDQNYWINEKHNYVC